MGTVIEVLWIRSVVPLGGGQCHVQGCCEPARYLFVVHDYVEGGIPKNPQLCARHAPSPEEVQKRDSEWGMLISFHGIGLEVLFPDADADAPDLPQLVDAK